MAIPPDKHFSYKTSTYNYNLRENNLKQIVTKNSDVDSYTDSFFPRTIIDWNELSEQEVNCQSVNSFEAGLQRNI